MLKKADKVFFLKYIIKLSNQRVIIIITLFYPLYKIDLQYIKQMNIAWDRR